MLELRRPMHGRVRVYTIDLAAGLFGDFSVVVAYGRLGWRPTRKRSEPFDTEAKAVARVRQLLRIRFSHGYEIASGDASRFL